MSEPIYLFVGSYANMADAEDDLKAVDGLYHFKTIGSYDAAIITRDADGKLQIDKAGKLTGHYTRNGLLIGGFIGLFAPAVLLGAAIGAGAGKLAGHFKKNLSGGEIKDVGELLDSGEIVLVVATKDEVRGALQTAMVKATRSVYKQVPSDSADMQAELDAAVKELEQAGQDAAAPADSPSE